MILLQVGQLILQTFNLHLQVSLVQGGLVQQASQIGNVSLHGLTHYQFVLVPNQWRKRVNTELLFVITIIL